MDRLTPCQRPVGERVVMYQSWRELLFLHWEVEPAALQTLLPPGLTLDTFEGKAYIGLVPFTMRDVRPVWSPSVPGLSHFHETNVRTYVHKDGEAPGVWFFSLDAANAIAVWLARTLWRLPYYTAKMSLKVEEDGTRRYRTERKENSSVGGRFTWRPEGEPAASAPGTLTHFLCERYLLYAYKDTLWRGQVHRTL
ncbi:MAG: DUF2071 domain-containing protein [Armatimonas sp.]